MCVYVYIYIRLYLSIYLSVYLVYIYITLYIYYILYNPKPRLRLQVENLLAQARSELQTS